MRRFGAGDLTMWHVVGTSITSPFQALTPERILYEFDGPRIFTVRHELGEFLAYLSAEDVTEKTSRYLLVPTDDAIVAALEKGTRTVYEALAQPWVWILDIGFDGQTKQAWRTITSAIPADCLPKQHVMLWPELEPLVSIRMIGDSLEEGQIPGSVIRRAVEGVANALKKLAESALGDQKRQGLTVRQFYDLPAQHFAFRSFEISFRAPDLKQLQLGEQEGVLEQQYDAVAKKFSEALDWAITADPEESALPSIDLDLLKALERLVPPQTGVVERVELRGQLFKHLPEKRFELSRQASRNVTRALARLRDPQEKVRTLSGLIDEFDKGKMTFTLRYTGEAEYKCSISDELYDEVMELFKVDNERVTVTAWEAPGKKSLEVIRIVRASIEDSQQVAGA